MSGYKEMAQVMVKGMEMQGCILKIKFMNKSRVGVDQKLTTKCSCE